MAHKPVFTITLGQPVDHAPGPQAVWSGRGYGPPILSIESEMEKRLLALRSMHMHWAYEMGIKYGPALDRGEPLSMWWTSLIYERHPRLSPWLFSIYKLAWIEEWLLIGNAGELRLIGDSPTLKTTLAELCAKRNIRFTHIKGSPLPPAKETFPAKLYRVIPAPVRAALRFIHWLCSIKSRLPSIHHLPAYPEGFSAAICTYFPNIDMQAAAQGRFTSRYWEKLHEILNEQARQENPQGPHFVRWLFIRFPAPGLSLKNCITLAKTFQKNGKDGLSFNFLEEFITARGMGRALLRWLKLCVSSLFMQGQFSKDCVLEQRFLNFWPWLKWDWAESFRGWRCLERCLFNEAFLRYCQLVGKQRWTLFALENCPWERMLTTAARRVSGNGPVFGAQHSCIRPTDFRYFDDQKTFNLKPDFQPDLICGNGASAIGQWRDNHMPPKRLTQVEALRYLYLHKNRLPVGSLRKRLVIATSFFREETLAHLQLAAAALAQGILRDWEIIWKPHPYLIPLEWLDNLPKDLQNCVHLATEPIDKLFAQQPCVWASNSTTVALEAAIAGLPVMVMAACNDFDLCPIQNIPGLIRTETAEDVDKGLKHMKPLNIAPDYLDLDPALPKWRKLLGLQGT